MKQSEKLFDALCARAVQLGRRLNKREWYETVDAFFASQKRRGGSSIHPGAEAIYLAYPRHVGRELALRAITNAIDRAAGDADSIMEATGAYAAAVKTWPKACHQCLSAEKASVTFAAIERMANMGQRSPMPFG